MSQTAAQVIQRESLSDWVRRLLRRAQIIAPRRGSGEDVSYDIIGEPGDVAWEYGLSASPLKRFLFPQIDPLLRWKGGDGVGLQVEPTVDDTPRVFLAVRSCDVSGVAFLDRAFSREREDIYYLTRRRNSLLISLVCTEPCENCFCVCANSGPRLESGYDLQLTRLGDKYLVEVGSGKGASLINEAGDLFRPASGESVAAARQLAREAESKFGDETAYFAAALRRVTFDRVPEELWEEIADRCLECGGCSFVCPTCWCFITADSRNGNEGKRERVWDNCLFESYALEASGHNPRGQRKHRAKARFFHKLSYQFAKPLEHHGCVGCGRCVTVCLGTIGMTAVTVAIRRGEL